MKPSQYAKAIVGAVAAALTCLAGFLLPGSTAWIAVTVALAFLGALGAVFKTKNSTPTDPTTPTVIRVVSQPPVPPQESAQAARAARLAHDIAADLNAFRRDMIYLADRQFDRSAARAYGQRLANLHRIADGLPAWHWRLARPVPGCGQPPV